MSLARLRVGFIPLVDAAALIVAADKGFAEAEGLDLELVREVSWSNMRDKLTIGIFDAAHLLAPIVVSSTLGLGGVTAPLIAPIALATNGNAVSVSPALAAELAAAAPGSLEQPLESARALAAVVERRKRDGGPQLVFGMTFPFSAHHYLLRFWMAAGGVDPDEDVRLVVLPPPFMVDSLSKGHVDGFCVGAPWNLVAAEAGVGRILHFGCDIFRHETEKVLALRESAALEAPETVAKLVRALAEAAAFAADPANFGEVATLLSGEERVGVDARMIEHCLAGRLLLEAGTERASPDFLVLGGCGRPDPAQAAFIYAQMARWRQAPLSAELARRARATFRPDLYDAALGRVGRAGPDVGAFTGPRVDEKDLGAYIAHFASPARR